MTRRLIEFDADPMLLGVANGVVDLRTGRLRSVSPQLLVTQRCNVEFDPHARCPIFTGFLEDIQPDAGMRHFLQRFGGYCLTGDVSAQVFACFHGMGANGKSVLIETFAWLMGEYSQKIATEFLMQHQRNPQGPSPDIVALKGKRLIYAVETEEGQRLAAGRVKELTGGDRLTGRVPYARAAISFEPTHKLIIVGNHKPEIADMSDGMWRRVLHVGFGETIEESRRDPHLLGKLKGEGSGILNWLLEGLQQWRREGLSVPAAVKQATGAYRDEQDILAEWIAECCEIGATYSVPKKDLYSSYTAWAVLNGHGQLSQTRLTQRLNDRGFQLQRDKRTVKGLAFKRLGPPPAT